MSNLLRQRLQPGDKWSTTIILAAPVASPAIITRLCTFHTKYRQEIRAG